MKTIRHSSSDQEDVFAEDQEPEKYSTPWSDIDFLMGDENEELEDRFGNIMYVN